MSVTLPAVSTLLTKMSFSAGLVPLWITMGRGKRQSNWTVAWIVLEWSRFLPYIRSHHDRSRRPHANFPFAVGGGGPAHPSRPRHAAAVASRYAISDSG